MDLENFIKPELYVIVPVLYTVGSVLKNSKTVRDNLIPLILCAISILIASIYIMAASDDYSFKSLMLIAFTSITQGFLCAGAAVLTYQLKKQYEKSVKTDDSDDEDDDDTK